MSLSLLFFIVIGAISLAAAYGVVASRLPIHSALFLLVHFAMLAVLYITLDAQFLAATQVIVYAGGIVILILFVIMLMDVREEERRRFQKFGTFLGIAAIAGLAGIMTNTVRLSGIGESLVKSGEGETDSLGKLLFTSYVLPFEIISVLLLVAMVGCILLSKREESME